MNVLDGLELNRATSVPKSVLRYSLDKGSNSDLVYLNFFSDFQGVPNKSSMNELNNFFVVVVVLKMNRCCDVINVSLLLQYEILRNW